MIAQYPSETKAILGNIQVTDTEGFHLMTNLVQGRAIEGSDGSVKYGIGGRGEGRDFSILQINNLPKKF